MRDLYDMEAAALSRKSDWIARLDELKARIDAQRPLDPDALARVMAKLRLDWNYHSNAIEGNTLTLGETRTFLLHGLTAKGKPIKDHLDLKGHDTVLAVLYDLISDDEPLTEALIRNLDKQLLGEPYFVPAETTDGHPTRKHIVPGRYKEQPNHVMTPNGAVHYYASPEDTPARMGDLVAWARDSIKVDDLHPMAVSTVFHHAFTAIHPFDDGNGRLARILSNLLLMQRGYLPVVVPNERRDEYLYHLAQADAGDLPGLMAFFCELETGALNLMLRALEGEDITELGDVDRRLALIRKRLEGELTSEKTPEAQQRVIEEVFVPILRSLVPRLERIDDLFAQRRLYASIQYKGGSSSTPSGTIVERIEAIIERARTEDVLQIMFYQEWEGFAVKPSLSLILSLNLEFAPLQYAIVAHRSTYLEAGYDELVSVEDVQRATVRIYDDLVARLEELTNQK